MDTFDSQFIQNNYFAQNRTVDYQHEPVKRHAGYIDNRHQQNTSNGDRSNLALFNR